MTRVSVYSAALVAFVGGKYLTFPCLPVVLPLVPTQHRHRPLLHLEAKLGGRTTTSYTWYQRWERWATVSYCDADNALRQRRR